MLKTSLKFVAVAGIVLLMSFVVPPKKIKVYLIGDSTMSIKNKRYYPETGWGMPFVNFFDEEVIVDNRAQNGRSTKSFLAENRWQSILDSLTAGDYVFIQFGHNDEVETKKNHTKPEEFKANLVKFITETKARNATPVLLTPVSRRRFDAAGKAEETHPYTALVKEVAAARQIPFIDLDAKSIALYQKFGAEASALLFNHLEPGVHPNYPEGKVDDTHFSELGAREIAQLVLQEFKKLHLNLADHIVKPTPKK
ncbi:rhamnogalacturonan acetylesterase [Pedobacter heparinus]|uniref:rhamnogalacturonan acetylesterase n=1 Tax=Pedobacter heparinus TaxID=984 RepID=UPI00292D7FD0|nr:rhamnogalacturonan acetylesterase [Pedobacter heparinus]